MRTSRACKLGVDRLSICSLTMAVIAAAGILGAARGADSDESPALDPAARQSFDRGVELLKAEEYGQAIPNSANSGDTKEFRGHTTKY